MTDATKSEWIYDWNTVTPPAIAPGTRVLLNDETLRDGLQNPSVTDPSIAEKIQILHLMESLGIDSVNIGLPGAGPRAAADTVLEQPGTVRGLLANGELPMATPSLAKSQPIACA